MPISTKTLDSIMDLSAREKQKALIRLYLVFDNREIIRKALAETITEIERERKIAKP